MSQLSLLTLIEAQERLASVDRDVLIERFGQAFMLGKRERAYLFAQELTRRNTPPCFRHDWRSAMDYGAEQRADLVVFDLEWLRRRHREHVRVVDFRRCRKVFAGTDSQFLHEAAYMANGGQRAAWKIVKSLSLTEEQQAECYWLRSAPIRHRLAAVDEMRSRIFDILKRDLDGVRRTRTFTDADATAALLRRHRLWLARAYTRGGPAEAARRYAQMTGSEIDRKVAARQLSLVDDALRSARRERDHG